MRDAYRPFSAWSDKLLKRRDFGKLAIGSAAAASLTLSLRGLLDVAAHADGPAPSGAITGVDLSSSPYPFGPHLTDVMTEDPTTLNGFAAQYGQIMTTAGATPTPADFWFRYLPIPLFNAAIGDATTEGTSLGTSADDVIKRHLWMMHLVGYYGGVWFGKKLDEFSCGVGIRMPPDCNNPSDPATDADFGALHTYLVDALGAAYADDPQVPIDRAEFALRMDPSDSDGVLQALITLYGYNVGYTQAILDPVHRPNPATDCVGHGDTPAQWDPPENSQVENYNDVFGATFPQFAKAPYDPAPFPPPVGADFDPVPFLTGDTDGLKAARALHAAAADLTPGSNYFRIFNGAPDASRGTVPLPVAVRSLYDQAGLPVPSGQFLMGGNLVAQQIAASRVGFSTWSVPTFLDVRGWDRPSYRGIIGLSIYFVQAVQLTGLACLAAAANASTADNRARDAVLCSALVQPFGGSYLVGLNDGGTATYCTRSADASIPQFTYS